MKIEKINDNQIRCRLSATDMRDMNIRLTDLAYGSEKAHMLFKDMMKQAHRDYGFNADNCPIMVEAIPMGREALDLIITRVEEPDELDTRFSRFSQPSEALASSAPEMTGVDDVLDFFDKMKETLSGALKENDRKKDSPKEMAVPAAPSEKEDLTRFYVFDDLDTVIEAARAVTVPISCRNALYHVAKEDVYLLVLHKGRLSPLLFNRVCNSLSEFAALYDGPSGHEAHLREHEKAVLKAKALQKLAEL